MNRVIQIFKYVILVVLIVLIFTEVSLRVYINYIANLDEFFKFASLSDVVDKVEKGELNIPIKFHPYLGYTLKENYVRGKNRHNSQGFRGKELPEKREGQIWIACVGGSTTYDDEIENWEDAYPAQLEKLLVEKGYDVQVINAGTPGWTSWEILIDYIFRLSYLPIDILIYYECANELATRVVYPHSAYKPDNSGTRSSFPGLFHIPCWEQIAVIRVPLVIMGIVLPHSTYIRTFDRLSPSNFAEEFTRQNFAGVYPSGIFKEVPYEEMLKINPPVYFERNLKRLVILASNDGVKPVLVTFAIDRSPGSLARMCGVKDSNSPVAYAVYSAFDEMNTVVRKVADETSAYFFDFASIYPNDPTLYVDSLHNNEKGARLKAEMFAEFLIREHLLSK